MLALSLRLTSHAELSEIVTAWFEGRASSDSSDLENIAHLGKLEDPAAT